MGGLNSFIRNETGPPLEARWGKARDGLHPPRTRHLNSLRSVVIEIKDCFAMLTMTTMRWWRWVDLTISWGMKLERRR